MRSDGTPIFHARHIGRERKRDPREGTNNIASENKKKNEKKKGRSVSRIFDEKAREREETEGRKASREKCTVYIRVYSVCKRKDFCEKLACL